MATPGYPGPGAGIPLSHPAPPYQPTPVMQPVTPQAPTEQSPTKDVNTAALCHLGQETVNEVMYRTYELFQALKALQLPNGVNSNMDMFQERRNKINGTTEVIRQQFQKLRVCYNKVLMDTANLQPYLNEELVPYEGAEIDDSAKSSDLYRYVDSERRELVEQIHQKNIQLKEIIDQLRDSCQIHQKNVQLKEIIDQLRGLVWEINTMITMRKS